MPSKAKAPEKQPSFFASIFGFGSENKPKATKKTTKKSSSTTTKKSRPKQQHQQQQAPRGQNPRQMARPPSLASLQYPPQAGHPQQPRLSPARSNHSLGSHSRSEISVAEPIYVGHPSPNNISQDMQSHYSQQPLPYQNDEFSQGQYPYPDDYSYGPNGPYPPAYGPTQYPFPPMPYGAEYPYPPYPYPYPAEPRRQKPLTIYKRVIHESLEEAAEDELRRRADEEALEQAIQMSLSGDAVDPNQEKIYADDDAMTSALIRSVYDQGPQRPYDPRIHGPLLQNRSNDTNDEQFADNEGQEEYNVEEENYEQGEEYANNGQEEYLEEGNYEEEGQNQEYEQEDYDQEADEIDDSQDLYYLQQRHSANAIGKKPFQPVMNQHVSYPPRRNYYSNKKFQTNVDNESYEARMNALKELQRPSYEPPRIEPDEYEEPEEEKADEFYEKKGKYQTVSFQSPVSNLNSMSFASYDSGSVPYVSSASADNFVVTEDCHRDLMLGDD